MFKYVHKYCTSCNSCASNKPRNYSPLGPTQQVAIPNLQWTSVSIDFVGPLPMSSNSIMAYPQQSTQTEDQSSPASSGPH
eukprot:599597-Rhodomonas_salina.1